ncbi:T9SS outer membrane translocon Sov/SprA [Flavobacterium silvaticum]|uniref:Cell surface protein SprA n=1 Tax=Flavobacterium silvaticum TaxID=1852020 RepID=A0A972JFD3_9FLAO|nr:cell surface protein SprA [Flavobacterium silvaticum]NMH27101.1 cell surface protein SprA [Flavobacterium silvaticum]
MRLKTEYLTKIYYRVAFIFLLLLTGGFSGFAQVVEEDDTPTDTIGYNQGKLNMGNPPSIIEAYSYDPVTDRYIYTNTFDGFNINYPIILTPAEYQELVTRENMRKYFQEKSDAIDGKKEGSEDKKKDLLPRYYVNSGFFQSVFGSNTIDVKPTGNVEMDLGVRYTKTDNPALSPRNRASTTFDFDQRISMSLMGKVGTRLAVNVNYDTESTFAFQNLIKLEYTPDEDDILQKIEVGNVSLPLSSSLIRGAQSLFGVKAQLQFGRTTVTGVFSEQKSQTKTVTAQGGGTIQDFELFALDYDSDRHYFLSQYFRDHYDDAMRNYPFIDSRVQITRIEVWVTNRQNRVAGTNNNMRNIVALQDLGESQLSGEAVSDVVVINPVTPATFFTPNQPDLPPDNSNNQYDPALITAGGGLLNSNIREIVTASAGFNFATVSEGRDYSKLENARKLTTAEFTYHPQLGYISLQQKLSNDEVLAVSYQYTIGSEVYQVGEFGTDGVDATQATTDPNTGETATVSTQSLVLKMLRSSLTNVNMPVWDLMMKNIYQIPGAFQLEQEDFRFNILYTDPSPLNYITPVSGTPFPASPPADPVAETPLLKVFNMDRLNYNNDPQVGGDGFFDYLPGLTVDTQYGRIIFSTTQPFGETLFNKLRLSNTENYQGDETSLIAYNDNQRKYVYKRMYESTQADALQQSEKNKFQLRGRFKSSGGDGIPIGAYNVPQGSVVVTAGGRVLVEGVDYSVNYQLGRVQILDPSLQASNTPIEVSVENNSNFGQQTRRFFGVNVEHKFSEKFLLGATFLKMTEKPFTQKSNYGQESVNNSIFGVNGNYATEVPFLTRMVNHLPNIDTDVPSNISVRAEVAFLKPDTPKADRFEGESTLYVDDFEGSQTTIDMRSPLSWSLSSTPENNNNPDPDLNFNFNASATGLEYGFKRAKLSWYTIDPIFYAQRPTGISAQEIGYNSTRRIYYDELYPDTDIAVGQTTVVSTLDLSYYPQARGPFNYNPQAASTGVLPDPSSNFGGIMRALNSTNFEQSNVEYVQFWVMDPYFDQGNPDQQASAGNTGTLFIDLGAISEDILKDGRKQFENGLGPGQVVTATQWGNVPASQSLIYAFDVDGGNREAQDLGFDGLTDDQEAVTFPEFAGLPDPSGDNYQYYLNVEGNVIERYLNYNGTQGNSPVTVGDTNRGSTTLPDIEDVNRDNTMNTINAYFEYAVKMYPNMNVGDANAPFLVDKRTTPATNLPSGANATSANWLLFKIPVSTEMVQRIGGISDFRTVQFMRMFLTGFSEPVTLRFGALDLVRGEWRRYTGVLDTDTDNSLDQTNFDVQALNIQENGTRCPVNYVSPPNVQREQLYQNNSVINQNEQALALRVDGQGGIEPGDARSVFKNVQVDFRQFKKLKMFLHAEAIADNGSGLNDNEMVAFIRFGNDFSQNFYEVQVPLKVTQATYNSSTGTCLPLNSEEVWPEANNMDLSLDLLTKLKVLALSPSTAPPADATGIRFVREGDLDASRAGADNELRIGIKGNPNFGLVRTIMIGIRNNTQDPQIPRNGAPTIARDIRGEVWFNELRLADMDNKGGWAGVVSMDSNVADFMTVSGTGRISTIGFGSLEQGPNERSREDLKQYNIVTNVNLGKLLPKKWGVNLPFNYAIGEETSTPKYDPYYQDIELQQLLDNTADANERANLKNRAIDYTKRSSINFIGVRKERAPEQKQRIYDPENLTLSYSYNEVNRHNYEIESYIDQQVSATADYNYSFQPKPVEPFKNSKYLKKSSYWKMLQDFNFNYLPSSLTFNSNVLRQYNKQQFRNVDVDGIPIDALYQRNYLFNYQYGFNFNLTKSLKINYNATSSHVVRNYIDENNVPDNSITVWDDFFSVGIPNQHNQQLVVNYDLPLYKLPFLSFLKTTYSYTGDYSWNRASIALSSVEVDGVNYNLGNTIQNAASHKINAALNMESFYKYIGLVKKPKKAPAKPAAAPKPGEKITNTNVAPAQDSNMWLDGLIGVATSIKNIQLNYVDTRGTVLPGYVPGLGFFGTSKPTLGFVFGSQDDVRYEAAKRGYLTTYQEFNQNYTEVTNKTLDFTANIDLFPDLKIDLTGNRTYADNYSEQYDVGDDERTVGIIETDHYNSRSPYSFGNFSITTVMLKTSFKKSDEFESSPFQDFRDNRIIIANRLATQYYGTTSFPVGADGFPVGFGKNSQAVLLPAFMAAYTGTGLLNSGYGEAANKVSLGSFRDVPIPNWTIKYSGLMRYKFFKDRFKRFSLQSSYRASYTINSFRSNFEYDQNPNGTDTGGNFFNKTIISNVNLVEQFNPLMRVDFEMKNSFKFLAELKKDRALSMSFDNNLLTEVQGMEYVLGLGYRVKDVTITSRMADDPSGVIRSDINIKLDGSYRNNKTIVRNLDYDNNQIGGGQNIWAAKLTADYSFSKNLTLIFYYDHQFSKAVISTSFPMTNIRAGFTLRYNFGN